MSAAEVVAQHVTCDCGEWAEDSTEHAQHQLDALKAAGYAVIELPEQMPDRSTVAESLRDQPMWEIDGSWTCRTAEDCIEFEAAHQTECGTLTVAESRSLAAALLAAADSAEVSS